MSMFAVAVLVLIAYTYVGYPLVVFAWARVAPRRVAERADYEPLVSVCLAVSNGAAHVARKLDSLLALDYPTEKLEIVVCDDGSTDATRQIVLSYAARDPRIRLVGIPRRTGKPSAINKLKETARGEVLLMTDVRQRLAEGALRELLRPLADAEVGCVSGSLVLEGRSGAGAYWRYERLIRESEGRLGAMVGVSGSVYAIRRADLPTLPPDLILDDMFVPLHVALGGKRVVFARGAEAFDDAFDDEREFNRKVRTLAGNFQLVSKLPRLLVPGADPVWFELVSHKLLRLVCPWLLLLLLFTSLAAAAGTSDIFWTSLALVQLAFYALAALGAHAGRLAALARTFVVLNAAAVVGFWRYVRGTQAVTW